MNFDEAFDFLFMRTKTVRELINRGCEIRGYDGPTKSVIWSNKKGWGGVRKKRLKSTEIKMLKEFVYHREHNWRTLSKEEQVKRLENLLKIYGQIGEGD